VPFDDDAEDHDSPFRPPPHPDDRIWRHPSELGAHPISPLGSPLAGADQRRGRPWGVMVAAGTAGAVLAGAGVVAFGLGERVVNRPVVERVALDQVASSPGSFDAGAIEGVRQRVAPAVVAVESPATTGASDAGSGPAEGDTGDTGDTSDTGDAGAGSGVVVRNDGIVLTSAALVAVGMPVAVRLSDGSTVDAEVLGVDKPTGLGVLDLAGEGFTTGVLAAESDLELGETSFTVGAGAAGATTTAAGVIGATRRYLTSSDTTLDGVVEVTGDAPMLALGGPLVDRRGAVIGVVTAIHDDGMASYVAPVEVARKVSGDVLAHGHVRHSWLGIDGRDADADADPDSDGDAVDTLAAAPATTASTASTTSTVSTGSTASTASTASPATTAMAAGEGVIVASVVPDGPADRGGLEEGDVIVELGGRPIAHMPDLVLALRSRSPGDRVDTTVVRSGGTTTLEVTLGEAAAGA
jgi:S1-C subfamily serine protease